MTRSQPNEVDGTHLGRQNLRMARRSASIATSVQFSDEAIDIKAWARRYVALVLELDASTSTPRAA